MRHSKPVLTADVYTRLELHDLRGAVDRLSPVETGRRKAAQGSL